MKKNKISYVCLSLVLGCSLLAGCGSGEQKKSGEKVFTYGTVAYGPQHDDAGLNPHTGYSGWSAVRYGVGETLFKFNDAMEPTPWLAKSFEQVDARNLKIVLKDNVTFSNGKKVDAAAVKACFEQLVKVHTRAQKDLKIASIKAEGNTLTITTTEDNPALVGFLSDPYASIVDVSAGVTKDRNVVGTGPFVGQTITDSEVILVKNTKYWNGTPKVDKVHVKAITDGDTMTMALQSGELDATQGLPYNSLELFTKNEKFNVASRETSRVFQARMNFRTPALQDLRVRQAIASSIDKENFTKVLLKGNGTPAVGPFPNNLPFGGSTLKGPKFDLQNAKSLLASAGWKDTNGDGYVDKNGQNLTIRWLTYPGRIELPLLAEAVQASLKQVGVKVDVNSTANHRDFMKRGEWDIFANAMVTAPTGDPGYYIQTLTMSSSAENLGKYENPQVDEWGTELSRAIDRNQRTALALKVEQQLLDDVAFIYASHLKMSFVMKKNVQGFKPHPSDYYEITADLDV